MCGRLSGRHVTTVCGKFIQDTTNRTLSGSEEDYRGCDKKHFGLLVAGHGLYRIDLPPEVRATARAFVSASDASI